MKKYEAAVAVLASLPSLIEWSAGRDEVSPRRDWIRHLRRAGWPSRMIAVGMPQFTSSGQRTGRTVEQEIYVVPGSWLRAAADLIGMPHDVAIRSVFDAEE